MSDQHTDYERDIADVLRDFLQAYPEDIFPTPPPEWQAKDAAAAHVMRRLALPTMARALAEIEWLRAHIDGADDA
jgi:hypothetical protein